jgi:hypothetical protein
MNNFIYTVLNAGIPVIFIVVSALILVMCNKAFRHQCNLRRHQRIHSGEHPYTCDVCKKAFRHQCNLRRHQRIHSGERPYICDVRRRSDISVMLEDINAYIVVSTPILVM